MIYIWQAEGINDIYPEMIQHCMDHGQTVTQRGLTTRELSPVIFQLNDPRQRLVTSYGRPVNVAFALAEVLWILNGCDDVEMLAAYNSRISTFSDDGVRFNAAYGRRLRASFGHDQLEDCIRVLTDDIGSRQAVLQINHPAYDRGYNPDPTVLVGHRHSGFSSECKPPQAGWLKHNTKDRACNVSAHMLVRDGRLHWTQFMRSNDALWGTPYNVIQWTHVQEYIAARLGVYLGSYTHLSDSFHIYDPPLDDKPLPEVEYYNLYWNDRHGEHGRVGAHAHMQNGGDVDGIRTALEIERMIRTDEVGGGVTVSPFWQPFVDLFQAHRYYTTERDAKAYQVLVGCPDQVYAAAQVRFYVENRWKQHPERYPDILARLSEDYTADTVDWIMGRPA